MSMMFQTPPMTVGCLLCSWKIEVPTVDAGGAAHDVHALRCPGRVEALAETMKTVWLRGTPFKPGGEIDWARYARAVQSALTSKDEE